MTHSTYADIFLPVGKKFTMLYNIVLVVAGSILITLSAKISIPLSFSPIPVTIQTLVILLIGTIYGSKRSSLAVLVYISQGIIGIPVFAKTGSGFAYLLGPTGGYLIGFVFAAFITGYFAEKGWDRSFWKTSLAMTIGTSFIFIFGVGWLCSFHGFSKAVMVGFVPFIVEAIITIIIAITLIPSGWKILEKLNLLKP